MSHDEHSNDGYEKSDANILIVSAVAIGIVVTLAVCLLGVHEMYFFFKERTYRKVVLEAPNVEILEMNTSAAEKLTSYGLVDGKPNTYRIPIQRAKELIVQEGQ